jgi:hypothetical protein
MYAKSLALFPANDPTLGAPFNTGDSLFDRAEAWYTDLMFLTPRRSFFQRAASLQKMFAYYFREFIPGSDPALGGKRNPVSSGCRGMIDISQFFMLLSWSCYSDQFRLLSRTRSRSR